MASPSPTLAWRFTSRRTQKFFPRPSELREGIDGSSDERADLAWTHLLQEIRRVGPYGRWNREKHDVEPPTPTFFDDAAKRAALELYGGWPALCEKLPGDGPALLGAAKLFKATYRAYANRVNRDALPPIETDPQIGRTQAKAVLSSAYAALKERGL